MSDLISRQAATDEIRKCRFVVDAIEKIRGLPPAQLEQRWIPCSERLPNPLQEVLVTSTRGYVYTSRIVHGDFEYGGNVIAWMPLPEPWKGDEADEAD